VSPLRCLPIRTLAATVNNCLVCARARVCVFVAQCHEFMHGKNENGGKQPFLVGLACPDQIVEEIPTGKLGRV